MNNNEIIMNLEDYKTILTHAGKIDGIVGICKINEFDKQLDESLKKSLSKAKALTIKFGFHKNQSLFIISNYVSEIHDLTCIDTDIIFGTEHIDNIDENLLRFEIIVTGIE